MNSHDITYTLRDLLIQIGQEALIPDLQKLPDTDQLSLYQIVTSPDTDDQQQMFHDLIVDIHHRSKDIAQQTQQLVQQQTTALGEAEQTQSSQEADDLLASIE